MAEVRAGNQSVLVVVGEQDGVVDAYVAGYARDVGLYPTPSGMEAFEAELAPYRSGKGTARFPLDAPLPTDLIRRVVAFRVGEVEAAAKRRRPEGSGGG